MILGLKGLIDLSGEAVAVILKCDRQRFGLGSGLLSFSLAKHVNPTCYLLADIKKTLRYAVEISRLLKFSQTTERKDDFCCSVK